MSEDLQTTFLYIALTGFCVLFFLVTRFTRSLYKQNERILQWHCDYCGKPRPDKKLSVWSVNVKGSTGLEPIRSYKYCNDNTDCIAKAILKKPVV